MESDKELREKIRPILEKLVYQLVSDKPNHIVLFMIQWLQKYGGYTSNGLTLDEKNDLERLRVEVKKYREMATHEASEQRENDNISEKSADDPDDLDENLDHLESHQAKQRLSAPRAAVSAEVYGKFNKKENFTPRSISKTDDQIQRIKIRILTSFLFGSLDQKDLSIIIDAMDEKQFKEGSTVIEQGESGDCLFVVEVGKLSCYKRFTKEGEAKLVKTYGPGDAFGELALLYNSPRAATVIAQSDCILWQLDRETFNHIVKDAAQKKREKYESFLKSVDILSTMEPYELMQISDALKTATFHKDDYIIKEGELGDVFYILEEGEAKATKILEPGKPQVEIMNYKEGDYFGERALIKGEPRYASIIAKSDVVKVISLDRDSFKRLLGPIESLLQRNLDKYAKFFPQE